MLGMGCHAHSESPSIRRDAILPFAHRICAPDRNYIAPYTLSILAWFLKVGFNLNNARGVIKWIHVLAQK